MSEWQEVALGSFARIKGGKRLPKGFQLSQDQTSHPYIRTTDISNHRVRVKELLFVPDEVFPTIKNYIVNAGDLIISIVGTIGSCALIPPTLDKASLTENCAKIVSLDENKLDKQFLYYFLISEEGQAEIESRNVGSTQPKLPLYNIAGMPIPLPPLEEQKTIASILRSLDDNIELLHRQNTTLECMAETLFRQWFMEGTQVGREKVTIADLIEFNPSRKLSKNQISTYLDMAGLSTSNFNPTGWYEREFSSGTKFINNDTLLARITPCLENGKTGYVSFLSENEVGWGSTEFIVMRSKLGIHPFFSYVLARYQDFRDYAEGCMEGSSGRQRVNIDHLKQYQIRMPSDEIIKRFNEVISAVTPKLELNSKKIQTLEKLRDNLLPKLMSGEVRVA